MRLVKGILIGTAVTAAAYMMYTEGIINKKKMMKKARHLVQKMGMN